MSRAWLLGLALMVSACKTTQGPSPVAEASKADPLLASGGSLHDSVRSQPYKSSAANNNNGTPSATSTSTAK